MSRYIDQEERDEAWRNEPEDPELESLEACQPVTEPMSLEVFEAREDV
jgi:hypothetical protein